MSEQLCLFPTEITHLRPVLVERHRPGQVIGYPIVARYWQCACGKTLAFNQVVPHLIKWHFYPPADAELVFHQAKHQQPQHIPTLINLYLSS